MHTYRVHPHSLNDSTIMQHCQYSFNNVRQFNFTMTRPTTVSATIHFQENRVDYTIESCLSSIHKNVEWDVLWHDIANTYLWWYLAYLSTAQAHGTCFHQGQILHNPLSRPVLPNQTKIMPWMINMDSFFEREDWIGCCRMQDAHLDRQLLYQGKRRMRRHIEKAMMINNLVTQWSCDKRYHIIQSDGKETMVLDAWQWRARHDIVATSFRLQYAMAKEQ